jgi:hypothetical protein
MSDSTSDSNLSEVQKLIRLKRYEQPPRGYDAYCEDFLFEFQQRQRVEMLRRSSFSLWLEKVASWFWGFGTSKWVWGGAAAYASMMMFAYLNQDSGSDIAEEPVGPKPTTLAPSVPPGESQQDSGKGGKDGLQPVSAPRFKEL